MKLLKFLSVALMAIVISQNSYAAKLYGALDYINSDAEFNQKSDILNSGLKDTELVNKSSSPHGFGFEFGMTFGNLLIVNPHIFGAVRDVNLHYREQNVVREAGIDDHQVSIGNSAGIGLDLGIGNYKYAYFYIGGDFRYSQIDYQTQKFIGDAAQTAILTESEYQSAFGVSLGLVTRLTTNLNLKIEFESESYDAYDIRRGQLSKGSFGLRDTFKVYSTKVGIRYEF